ncbi:MAG: energy transducer TonB [Ignavibacteriaceae bacterium]|nr:energy transducer TonB [Ignavibacteriaceae bacterium]
MKNNALIFPGNVKIDFFEFKKTYAKNFSLGMSIAVLIHILLIGVYYFIHTTEKGIVSKHHYIVVNLSDQPSINIPFDPPIAVSSPGTSAKNAIPVPVPDDKAVNETLIPTQSELSRAWVQTGSGNGEGVKEVQTDIKTETRTEVVPDIKKFIPLEIEPEVVEPAIPQYPELAKRAGIEGTVVVKVLIGKDGKPVKAVAVKFDSEIFVQPSLDAAMKFVFTPAIQHKAPVMVWTTIPFKFRLNN